jgi:uncharacterized repeat protein (TIGR04076 family)
MSEPKDLLVRVIEIKGHCPVYSVGDSFRILEGFKLVAEKPLCMHSLASFMLYYVALSRGASPAELGLAAKEGQGREAYVQCLDPCERTGGGTVVFAITWGDKPSHAMAVPRGF